jgi:hypothetical protein
MRRTIVGASLLIILSAARAEAQRATQVVRFHVIGITEAAIHSNAPNIPVVSAPGLSATSTTRVQSADQGGVPVATEPVWSATFSLASTEDAKKIVVALDRPMTDGSVLSVSFGAPAGGASAGSVGLSSSTGKDAVTSIAAGNATSLPLEFGLSSPADSERKDQGSRTVSFTLITGA